MPAPRTCECMSCPKCRGREYARNAYRLRLYGRWTPHGDLEAVVEHLNYLRAERVGLERIHELTGLSRSTVYRIRAGKNQRITKAVAEAILAIRADSTLRVDPVGTSRRIRGLMALGWTTYYMADRLGISQGNLWELSKGRRWVTPATRDSVADLFAELSMKPGPSDVARKRAAVAGHVPPLAWNDIDDPNEQPKGVGTSEVDRADVMADVDSWGGNATDAARVLGIERHNLQKWCQRAGHSELYRRLAAREAIHGNQWTEGAA